MGRATPKMQEFAQAIADYLDIDPPDFESFKETWEFIDDHKGDYYEERRLSGDYDD